MDSIRVSVMDTSKKFKEAQPKDGVSRSNEKRSLKKENYYLKVVRKISGIKLNVLAYVKIKNEKV